MEKKTILVADNSVINRMQINAILASEYEIAEAEDGSSALAIMREMGADNIACVLLDLYMPGITGFDVLTEKVKDPAIADIPVIIITANNVTEAEVEALDLGASDFLSKPFEPEIIRRRVDSVVSAREAEDQRLRIRMLEEIAWHSDHDDLTGIFSRKAFLREAHEAFIKDRDKDWVLVVFDFEKFKTLNELFGTEAGDEVLVTAAKSLQEQVQGKGLFGRLNNDYFAFCAPKGELDVEKVLANISHAANEIIKEMSINLSPVISAGVYNIEDHDLEVSVMLDRAMIAQYTVKGDYNKHIAVYNEELSSRLLEEQEILNTMEAALENGEFRVVLQPVYDVMTGRPASAEALVRWHRPGHGIVPPAMFIPLFEQNGFITKMDENIWEQVCQILADRRDRGLPDLPISVNLSRRSIYNASLYDTIVGIVEKYDVDPELFRIEITESSYVDNPDRIIATVERLQDYGFTILMDDFGAGYSTLTSLKDIPVDILKADMLFMRDFDSGGRIGSIFTSIVRMARWLGIPVICEGVETEEQVEFLRSVGCRYSQGFYFARPMEPKEFEEYLIEHPMRRVTEEAMKFNEEDIDQIMGGNQLLDEIMNNIVDGYGIFEWNNGNPEMIRSSDDFADFLSVDKYKFILASVRDMDFFTDGGKEGLIEAFEEAIKTRGKTTLVLDGIDAKGDQLKLEVTIFCVDAIESDAMFFVTFRKLDV